MKHRPVRWVQGIVTVVSVGLALWLVHSATNWSDGFFSFPQFLCFLLCTVAIDRILTFALDMAIIAFGPSTARPRDQR